MPRRLKKGVKNVIQNNLPLIVWKHEYDLGIYKIDEHHRGIVSAINSLHYEMQQQQGGSAIAPVFKIMHEYTHIHFKAEETFFDKFDFPDAVSQRGLHRELLYTLSGFAGKSMSRRDPYRFMAFLREWWLNHICSKDRELRDYLLAQLQKMKNHS